MSRPDRHRHRRRRRPAAVALLLLLLPPPPPLLLLRLCAVRAAAVSAAAAAASPLAQPQPNGPMLACGEGGRAGSGVISTRGGRSCGARPAGSGGGAGGRGGAGRGRGGGRGRKLVPAGCHSSLEECEGWGFCASSRPRYDAARCASDRRRFLAIKTWPFSCKGGDERA